MSDSCSRCGYSEFPCSVHIHHIDRDRTNNDKSNLILLCANCHYGVHHHLWEIPELNGNYNRPPDRKIPVPRGPRPKPEPLKPKYLSVVEYSQRCGVSIQVVRAEIAKGRIPAEKIGKEYRIPVEDQQM